MGIISALKGLFNKNIECDCSGDNHVVFFAKKYKKLYVNKNIIVRNNCNCVIVYRNKITDVLGEGKYKITSESLPETFSFVKFDHNSSLKKIPCRIYFVNCKEFSNFTFSSKKFFKLRSQKFGKVKGRIKGKCTFKVLDSACLLKFLISNVRLKNDKIYSFLENKIGDAVCKKLVKNKINLNSLLQDQVQVEKILNTDLEDVFDKNGFYIKNIKLKSVDFSKKHKKLMSDLIVNKSRIPSANSFVGNVGVGNNCEMVTVEKKQGQLVNGKKTSVNINTFVLCKNCGKRNNITSKTCINCGKKLF